VQEISKEKIAKTRIKAQIRTARTGRKE